MMFKRNTYSFIRRHKTLISVLCLFVLSFYAIAAEVHSSNRVDAPAGSVNRVYLLHANTLDFDQSINPDFQILRGDVRFRQDSAYMFCDSAYFYEGTNSLDAFGNVRMEQGDTLFVYGDILFYDGNSGLARLRDNVKMINRDVTLVTDSFNYDRHIDMAYFFDGGVITDPQNELTSTYGQYSPQTKEAVFQWNVELRNPEYTLYSDTLHYNTDSGLADIVGPSTIVSGENTIYSDLGWYNTQTNKAMLLNQSRLVSKTQELTGDTIYYDRTSGFGEVFGHMHMNDTARKVILEGGYGYYNEITEHSFATKRAQAIEYSTSDSLFLHADTLRSDVVDSARVIQAYYGVRFFRTDAQGVCDSLKYSSADSTIVMYKHPVLWNMDYQIYGDTIFIQMNDSTINHAKIKDFAFLAQEKTADYYDQLTGKVLDAFFREGELYLLEMSGNVETIFFPEEEDKSFIGLNNAESSFLRAYIQEQKLDKLVMWPKVNGSLTPIPMLNPSKLRLSTFQWYVDLRPTDRYDIFRDAKVASENMMTRPRIFTQKELEGNEGLDLPKIEQKIRSVKPTTPATQDATTITRGSEELLQLNDDGTEQLETNAVEQTPSPNREEARETEINDVGEEVATPQEEPLPNEKKAEEQQIEELQD